MVRRAERPRDTSPPSSSPAAPWMRVTSMASSRVSGGSSRSSVRASSVFPPRAPPTAAGCARPPPRRWRRAARRLPLHLDRRGLVGGAPLGRCGGRERARVPRRWADGVVERRDRAHARPGTAAASAAFAAGTSASSMPCRLGRPRRRRAPRGWDAPVRRASTPPDREPSEAIAGAERPRGVEQRERDREVERGPLLPRRRGREIDRDHAVRPAVARVEDAPRMRSRPSRARRRPCRRCGTGRSRPNREARPGCRPGGRRPRRAAAPRLRAKACTSYRRKATRRGHGNRGEGRSTRGTIAASSASRSLHDPFASLLSRAASSRSRGVPRPVRRLARADDIDESPAAKAVEGSLAQAPGDDVPALWDLGKTLAKPGKSAIPALRKAADTRRPGPAARDRARARPPRGRDRGRRDPSRRRRATPKAPVGSRSRR